MFYKQKNLEHKELKIDGDYFIHINPLIELLSDKSISLAIDDLC